MLKLSECESKSDTSTDTEQSIISPRYNKNKKNILVLWDFDWSLVNQNTDYYAQEKLYGTHEYTNVIYPKLKQEAELDGIHVFTDFMDKIGWPKIFKEFELNEEKFTKLISDLPIFPQNLQILHKINEHSNNNNNGKSVFNINQYIISNANQVLIDIVLKQHKLNGNVFKSDQIFTNMGWYDDKSGILRCDAYHGTNDPHDCSLNCAFNLCKGKILNEEILTRHQKYSQNDQLKIFIGDGGNDFCAISKLTEADYAFVRQFETKKGLEERIEKEGGEKKLKCNILKWRNGNELIEHFKKVLPEIFK